MAINVQGKRHKAGWLVFVVAANIGAVVLIGCCHLDKGSGKVNEQSVSTDTSNEQPVKAPDSVAQNDELKKARVLADQYMTELARKRDAREGIEHAKRVEKAIKEALAKEGPQSETAAQIAEAAAEMEGKNQYRVTWVETEDRGVDVLFVYALTQPFTFSTSNKVSLVYEKGSGKIRELRRP